MDVKHEKKAEIDYFERHLELFSDVHIIDNALQSHHPEDFQKAKQVK